MSKQKNSSKAPHRSTSTKQGVETFETSEALAISWEFDEEDFLPEASESFNALALMAELGDFAGVQALLDSMPQLDLNEQNFEGETPLHVACRGGSASCVKALLRAGASPDIKSSRGATALHRAASSRASRQCQHTILLLAELGVDIEAQDCSGRTPFLYACIEGNIATGQALLNLGANFWHMDANGHGCQDLADMHSYKHHYDERFYAWLFAEREKQAMLAALREDISTTAATGAGKPRMRL